MKYTLIALAVLVSTSAYADDCCGLTLGPAEEVQPRTVLPSNNQITWTIATPGITSSNPVLVMHPGASITGPVDIYDRDGKVIFHLDAGVTYPTK